jgi:hypothetical protein
MKKPAKCTTPKRDRETYSLNARDFRNLTALVKEANDILSYYVNMPENETGDLETSRVDDLENLIQAVEELKFTLEDVIWN